MIEGATLISKIDLTLDVKTLEQLKDSEKNTALYITLRFLIALARVVACVVSLDAVLAQLS